MTTADLQVVLNSKADVDFDFLDQDGHIIANYFSDKESKIPVESFLYSINGHPLHGSSASLLNDVKDTLGSDESYPLTLVFKSEWDKKRRKELTLPVPYDFLGEYASLTEEEITKYTKLAKSWVQGLLDASTSDKGFKYICTKENVDIYQGQDKNNKIQLVRGKTKIKCSKEEMRAIMVAPTTESFRRLFHMIDVHFQDGLVLHQFPQGYKHPDVPFYSIKWGVMGVKSTPLWLRDVCWLEYGDILTDENGQEFGFGVASSIERPECPSMEHFRFVRAEMMCSGYVFRTIPHEPDYMQVTYVVQADPKGWLPTWAVNMFAWQEALNVARIRNCAEGINQAKEKMAGHKRNGAAVQGVLVPYGKRHAIDVEVTDQYSLLSFGFCTANHNIGFYVTGITDEGLWSENTRYPANESPIAGQVRLTKGRHQLIFDNSYSWFTAKQVYYWFSLAAT